MVGRCSATFWDLRLPDIKVEPPSDELPPIELFVSLSLPSDPLLFSFLSEDSPILPLGAVTESIYSELSLDESLAPPLTSCAPLTVSGKKFLMKISMFTL